MSKSGADRRAEADFAERSTALSVMAVAGSAAPRRAADRARSDFVAQIYASNARVPNFRQANTVGASEGSARYAAPPDIRQRPEFERVL